MEVVEIDFVFGQVLVKGVQVGVVLLGNCVQGLVQFLIVDFDVVVFGVGDLQFDQDQLFEYLVVEYVIWRQLVFVVGVLGFDVLDCMVQFVLQYDVFVDYGSDLIQWLVLLGQDL